MQELFIHEMIANSIDGYMNMSSVFKSGYDQESKSKFIKLGSKLLIQCSHKLVSAGTSFEISNSSKL